MPLTSPVQYGIPRFRCIPDKEVIHGFFSERTFLEILASGLGPITLLQRQVILGRQLRMQLEQGLSETGLSAILFVFKGDPRAVGQRTHSGYEIQPLGFH